jgi:hypothetical protein
MSSAESCQRQHYEAGSDSSSILQCSLELCYCFCNNCNGTVAVDTVL